MDDDVQLGMLVKQHGFKQDVLGAQDSLSVAWYHSAREMCDGLQKNSFSVLNYQWSILFLLTMLSVIFFVFPWLMVLLSPVLSKDWTKA